MSRSLGIACPRICQTMPERLAPSGWIEHLPFAMWLVSVMQPRVLVELGTYQGTSYCGFCQAVAALGLSTRAFAVDTWLGDPHAGSLAPENLADLRAHHDPRYGTFSTLLQMTFDEAVSRFGAEEVDLLHIDGYHTYDAVRHDYETWRTKLSPRGVILFHDVTERALDFGVWKLWEELRSQHPSFTFEHEHGLGVLAVGSDLPQEIQTLVSLQGDEAEAIREFFATLGGRLRGQSMLNSTRAERDACSHSIESERAARLAAEAALTSTRQEMDQLLARHYNHCQITESMEQENMRLSILLTEARELAALHQQQLAELQSSLSWKVTRRLAAMGRSVAPSGTTRRRLLKQTAQLAHSRQNKP